jgi:hypothetical protein
MIRRFNTRGFYTIEEFCNILKNYKFSAGVPYLDKEGVNLCIAFPPLDNFNQVRIISRGGTNNERVNSWMIFKSDHKTGLGQMVKNNFLYDITDGWTILFSAFSSNARKGHKYVDTVLAEIQSLNL